MQKEPRIKYTLALKKKIIALLKENPSWGFEEISKQLNIPRRRMAEVANYFGIKIREIRHKEIIEDYKNGLTYKEISSKYNYSIAHIYKILKKNNLIKQSKKRRKKYYKNLEKKIKEYNYQLTKVADFYKTDIRTLKKYIKEKGIKIEIKKTSKRSKNVKKRFYEFMQNRPIPKNNRTKFYKDMAELLDASFYTIRKIAKKYENYLASVVTNPEEIEYKNKNGVFLNKIKS